MSVKCKVKLSIAPYVHKAILIAPHPQENSIIRAHSKLKTKQLPVSIIVTNRPLSSDRFVQLNKLNKAGQVTICLDHRNFRQGPVTQDVPFDVIAYVIFGVRLYYGYQKLTVHPYTSMIHPVSNKSIQDPQCQLLNQSLCIK